MRYDFHVFCCTNKREEGHKRGCCASKSADELRAYMKDRAKALGLPKTRINASGCLDRCEQGPVMVVYPEGVWYSYKNQQDVDEILEQHLSGGQPVERLHLP